jgi:hypothetical protein
MGASILSRDRSSGGHSGAFGLVWLCSNEKCPDKSKLSPGSSCPTCSSLVEEYRYGKLFHHLSIKGTNKDGTKNKQRGDGKQDPKKKEVLVSPEMSDEKIEETIRKDLRRVSSRHDWLDLPDLLETGDIDSPEDRLLTTLVDQSNILIRQNELILRILRRAFSQPPRSERTEAVAIAS